ncbi:MAG: ADP-forming succinate--CoA ligase subunit beta [Armatimonadetes bacterium]|nr:ADP-forming succinate--CoA ligase subunit beta [Armatimonadota bacterium]
MKIHEYQAKEVLARYGVAVPRGRVASAPEEARAIAQELGGRVVVKAQVHAGGRGKAGGIRLADTPEQAEEHARALLGTRLITPQAPQGVLVEKVLIEEALSIAQEYYLGITLDRAKQRDVVMVSAMGGMDIEQVAEEHPDAIVKVWVDPWQGLMPYQARQALYEAGIAREAVPTATKFLLALYKAYIGSDASLAEINPFVLTGDGQCLAADAKMNIDDNALFRHPELLEYREESIEDPLEEEAHRRGIQYVRLGGDIGIIGNGAGLVMSTLDEVSRAGGKPANFLDIGGGAKADLVRNALELVLMDPNVKGVLFNVFGGITRGDEVAKGILEGIRSLQVQVPIVIRLAGTRAEEGLALLQGTELIPAVTMQEAARKIVEVTR